MIWLLAIIVAAIAIGIWAECKDWGDHNPFL